MNFSPSVFLPPANGGSHPPLRPHLLAQRSFQIGILVKALGQNGPPSFKRSSDIRHPFSGIDKSGRKGLRIVFRLRQQHLRQRLETCFLGDFGLGAALRLERRVNVFEAPLGVGGEDRGFKGSVELALFPDRIEDGGATLLELAQVGQPLFQRTQLRVVERAGQLLAIAGNERNRGATVKQRDGGLDLLIPDAKLLGNLPMNLCHANSH